jgi:protein TonB
VEQFNFNLEAIMDRHFLIPATIAAALHGGLLFGIRPSSTLLATSKPVEPIKLISDFRFLVEPPVPDEDAEKSDAQTCANPAPTIMPEPPSAVVDGGFMIKVPESPGTLNPVPMTTIPLGPFGPPSDLPPGPGLGNGDIFGRGELDRAPRTRSQAAPMYPFEAKRDGRCGAVTVDFVVNEAGEVISPRVAASTDSIFNEAALRAVARWRFEPGRKDGHIVRFRMSLPMVFTLSGD